MEKRYRQHIVGGILDLKESENIRNSFISDSRVTSLRDNHKGDYNEKIGYNIWE